jgi:superfamily II DNA or RNA helicase
VLAYLRQAELWRSMPPPEPALRGLYQSLRAIPRPKEPWESGLRDLPELEGHLDASQDMLVLRTLGGVPLNPVQIAQQRLTPAVVASVLDLICAPSLREHALRTALLGYFHVPDWTRTLSQLDQALASRTELVADSKGRLPGWKLDLGNWKLTQVWTTPYKRQEGLRTAKMSGHETHVAVPQDQATLDVMRSLGSRVAGLSYRRGLPRAIAALENHPRVVDANGLLLSVEAHDPELAWVPLSDGGLRLELRILGRAAQSEQIHKLLEYWGAGLAILPVGTRMLVFSVPDPLRQILALIAQDRASFPAQARAQVMERFASMAALAPLTLEGDLRGVSVAGDHGPRLRITPEQDGTLMIQGRVRPLDGAEAYPPGEGPVELYQVIDGLRQYTLRDLPREPAQMRGLFAELGLHEAQNFELRVHLIERSLELVSLIQELDTKVEWTRPKPRVTRQAMTSDLSLRASTKRSWFGVTGSLNVGDSSLSLKDLLAAVRGGQRYVQVGDQDWVTLGERLQQELERIALMGKQRAEGVVELPMLSSLDLLELERKGASLELPETMRLELARMDQARALEPKVPDEIQATLRPYQVDGFAWLARMAHWAPGAVLADDMGLGKTLQALCLVAHRRADGPVLVVAPASVGINWEREVARFAPGFQVQSYRGAKREELLEALVPGQILITSWELMARDAERLSEVHFGTIVLDEAQAIKNPASQRSRASALLQAGFILALTGTPVENRVEELWSLMRTVVPGLLGSAQRFRERIVRPVERGESTLPKRVLSQLIRPFMLRRLKSQVAQDLPPRTEQFLRITLSADERNLYERFRIAALRDLKSKRDRDAEGPDTTKRMRILAAMTRLRQLSCHPGLVYEDRVQAGSTKLKALLRRLMDLRDQGHAALVFSQFTTLLGLAREALEREGLRVCYLDGQTPLKQRQAQVDAFQDGQGDVFLISLKAGGTGLNLTAASYVFHLDPWWNPAAEDQATDRAHRIGQRQAVTVMRMVAVDTIEEQVLALHQHKRALVSELLSGTGQAAALSSDELLGLLRSEGEVGLNATPQVSFAPVSVAELGFLEARYEEIMLQELASGALRSEATAKTYRRAVRNLLRWVREQGGVVDSQTALAHWEPKYLRACEVGWPGTGRADLKVGRAAYGRLAGLLVG